MADPSEATTPKAQFEYTMPISSPPPYCASTSTGIRNQGPLLYHNWQETVPDTATLPPPPIAGFFSSSTGNASCDDAERAHEFCDKLPLKVPIEPSDALYRSAQEYNLSPAESPKFNGKLSIVNQGHWKGSTRDGNVDCLLTTNLPLYFSMKDSPLLTEKSKTIYFEVRLLGLRVGPRGQSADASGFSIGFVAQPYPNWRCPGWERGSLGVFSDDGCRFVNDSWGGKGFTSKFKVGETVGLGITFHFPTMATSVSAGIDPKVNVDIFFTRDGQKVGGWNLYEELDEDSGGVEGLGGDFDLYGALGLFGGVDFEVFFKPADWLWTPREDP
ncbi:hypothetical protein AnigIFM63604_007791 [Aspergillus niger]|uniref:Contig An12c0010, genomic contig n=4 Tax=Aspergillus TaxID=5052 RepID=A2QY57_ASPNC|nr:uncharacterized protein An12g00060 [Aspergillus niger]XP_025449151.1 uncharacterized protein BO96DRAFT_201742 [Aspergillus niger CBS 101883]RDH23602.1 hypothetical protein M747DRAFT_153154 [Aspergillus niger ATCC 13496]RDK42629.1 hypothetical protein M752DRAFT_234760 [Aspergillus phoenicis ATCC 13157]PYH51096.1 hypothetical protein BO96DRAFT_201742 [Aspergillus niger CBS 101883]CAK40937.1 unnamed protein product [Aspergillus niger]GJP96538.1 D-lactate dehydrogenase [Aspergillus niger]|eukprot:XP_001395096.1 hypothetical protein ANI_1_1294104 [Aspergillus niger CBS 513.88]